MSIMPNLVPKQCPLTFRSLLIYSALTILLFSINFGMQVPQTIKVNMEYLLSSSSSILTIKNLTFFVFLSGTGKNILT